MGTLVGNGTYLYRRGGYLVRTPIVKSITLSPAERAYYSVAGMYGNGYPIQGVVGTDVVTVGKVMRKYFCGSTSVTRPGSQIWRQVTSSHDPEFVFYQGRYVPAYNAMTIPGSVEAYMQLAAYRFDIPTAVTGKTITKAVLSVIHGGTICQHQNPYNHYCELADGGKTEFAANADTRILDADSAFRTAWNMNIGVFSSLDDEPYNWQAGSSYQMTANLNTHLTNGAVNDPNYASRRQLWYSDNVAYLYNRGWIPVSTSPWTQNIKLNAAALSALKRIGGGWIVVAPNVGYSTGSDDTSSDYPFYYPAATYEDNWLCTSMWGYGLTVFYNEVD